MSSYITDLKEEFECINLRLKIIADTIDKISVRISDETVGAGSRVKISLTDGSFQEGRVWRLTKEGNYIVNRDGYANEFTASPNQITHLSVGTFGKLEKEQWLLKKRVEEIKRELTEFESKGKLSANAIKIILNSPIFRNWYEGKGYGKFIHFSKLQESPELYRNAVAKEFTEFPL